MQKLFIQTLQMKLCVRSKQPRKIKTIVYNDVLHLWGARKFNIRPGLLLLCTELTLFCIELPENCIYLDKSELSSFFMYLINVEENCNTLQNWFFSFRESGRKCSSISLLNKCSSITHCMKSIFQNTFYRLTLRLRQQLWKLVGLLDSSSYRPLRPESSNVWNGLRPI